jgi:SAM-dependent methyltransferase
MPTETYIHGTAPTEQERLATLNALTNPPFLRWLNVRETDCVLEVGSGLGILASENAARAIRGHVVGIEYSADQIARAPRSVTNLRCTQGDAHHLPFATGTFDVVYCRYVLEHVGSPLQVLREMRRVLKVDGRIAVQENDIAVTRWDPDCPRFEALWQGFIELQRRLGGDGLVGKRLFGLMGEAGFREIDLSFQPEIHWFGKPSFVTWVENIIGNAEGARESLVAHGIASDKQIDEAVAELRSFMQNPNAAAYFYWNRAEAIK